jgi:hypothetical protein
MNQTQIGLDSPDEGQNVKTRWQTQRVFSFGGSDGAIGAGVAHFGAQKRKRPAEAGL